MNYHVNEYIKNTVRVFPMQNRYGMHRYDMNENPEGLPKEFVDSVLKEITPEFLAIYPEPTGSCINTRNSSARSMKMS